MGARIAELVLRRETALALLKRAPDDVYVRAAIHELEGEPGPGEPGGPAREFHTIREAPQLPKSERLRPMPKFAAAKSAGLPARSVEILQGVSEGLTNGEIGKRLFISEDTVKTHLQRMYRKYHAKNRVALLAAVSQDGLL